jgi:hypothetical protein
MKCGSFCGFLTGRNTIREAIPSFEPRAKFGSLVGFFFDDRHPVEAHWAIDGSMKYTLKRALCVWNYCCSTCIHVNRLAFLVRVCRFNDGSSDQWESDAHLEPNFKHVLQITQVICDFCIVRQPMVNPAWLAILVAVPRAKGEWIHYDLRIRHGGTFGWKSVKEKEREWGAGELGPEPLAKCV